MGSAEVIGAAGGTGEFLCRRHNGQAANLEDAGGIGVVPHPPQTLVPSSGSTTPSIQTAPSAVPAWCLIPRKPFFLHPDAPRPQPNWRRRRGRRGASPPQTLVPSSGSTTPLSQTAPPAGTAWCLIPRKPLFLRPEAPRPQLNWRRRRERRGASSPANPYFFVRTHHALNPNDSAGALAVAHRNHAFPFVGIQKHADHPLSPANLHRRAHFRTKELAPHVFLGNNLNLLSHLKTDLSETPSFCASCACVRSCAFHFTATPHR